MRQSKSAKLYGRGWDGWDIPTNLDITPLNLVE